MTAFAADRIRRYLVRLCNAPSLADEDDLFLRGYLNSLYAVQLVQFVEREFAFTVDDDDLRLDNFRSVAAIAHLVARKAGPCSSS